MRSHRTLLASTALTVLFSTTALAQGTAPPAAQPPPAQPAQPAPPADAQPGYPPAQPGYPPQQYAPPPGYPQQQYAPPPGYPQQQYAPPPGYPQQPGYPPQGGYPPPPQGYLAPPPSQAPPPPAGKHGFLPIVYMGVNSFQGNAGQGLDAGFRLGTILGGRVNEMFSINGEMTIDILNPKNVTSGVDLTVLELDLAVSPLFHAQIGPSAEFVVGPKVGIMVLSSDATQGGTDLGSETGNGYVYGLNAGMFFTVGRTTSLGGILNFEGRSYSKICDTQPGFSEQCNTTSLPPTDKVLGISGAVMF